MYESVLALLTHIMQQCQKGWTEPGFWLLSCLRIKLEARELMRDEAVCAALRIIFIFLWVRILIFFFVGIDSCLKPRMCINFRLRKIFSSFIFSWYFKNNWLNFSWSISGVFAHQKEQKVLTIPDSVPPLHTGLGWVAAPIAVFW